MSDVFARASHKVADISGRWYVFLLALLVIVVWAGSGPIFHFSDTWQLVINTGTTIVTFLMVFLIQNASTRSDLALHLKVDELIRIQSDARNDMIRAEYAPEEALREKEAEFAKIAGAEDADDGL